MQLFRFITAISYCINYITTVDSFFYLPLKYIPHEGSPLCAQDMSVPPENEFVLLGSCDGAAPYPTELADLSSHAAILLWQLHCLQVY